ncbi:MAG: AmmeMemoRadiSam system protein B [Calditrichia bacterium]
MSTPSIRQPIVAGTFYPAEKDTLIQQIHSYLKEASKKRDSQTKVRGLVSPHAGYMYSGPVAGWSYKQVEGESYDVVVIISPSHYEAFLGCSIFPGDYYQTPLGMVKVDHSLSEALIEESSMIEFSEKGHHLIAGRSGEHALEVQLPFLQAALSREFSIIPIVMGSQIPEVIDDLSLSLSRVLKGKNYLIVASSDLSHYHSYHQAMQLDQKVLDLFAAYNLNEFRDCLVEDKIEACGAGPVLSMMKAIDLLENKKESSVVLKYANSGDVPFGDKNQVVGYMAGMITVSQQKDSKTKDHLEDSIQLSDDEKQILFRIARDSIRSELEEIPFTYPEYIPEKFKEKSGVFVTLTIDHQLRGCIGFIKGYKPLYQAVHEMAKAAAFDDPRFLPLTKEEFNKIQVEISILTPLRKIKNIEEITVGVHGLYIKKGYNSGLLLPQVAVEYHWDRQTFLEETCRKAGLPSDAWKDKSTEIYIFSALIIEEETVSQ